MRPQPRARDLRQLGLGEARDCRGHRALVLQWQLWTPDLVELFTREFQRELERLTRTHGEFEIDAKRRMVELETEIGNLAQPFLAGSVSPTLSTCSHSARRKAHLGRQLAARVAERATVVPHRPWSASTNVRLRPCARR